MTKEKEANGSSKVKQPARRRRSMGGRDSEGGVLHVGELLEYLGNSLAIPVGRRYHHNGDQVLMGGPVLARPRHIAAR